jgi:hypothetical protein
LKLTTLHADEDTSQNKSQEDNGLKYKRRAGGLSTSLYLQQKKLLYSDSGQLVKSGKKGD